MPLHRRKLLLQVHIGAFEASAQHKACPQQQTWTGVALGSEVKQHQCFYILGAWIAPAGLVTYHLIFP